MCWACVGCVYVCVWGGGGGVGGGEGVRKSIFLGYEDFCGYYVLVNSMSFCVFL